MTYQSIAGLDCYILKVLYFCRNVILNLIHVISIEWCVTVKPKIKETMKRGPDLFATLPSRYRAGLSFMVSLLCDSLWPPSTHFIMYGCYGAVTMK